MSIEIRQMLIKSDIVQRCDGGSDNEDDKAGAKEQGMKQELLAECRRMVESMLAQRRGDR